MKRVIRKGVLALTVWSVCGAWREAPAADMKVYLDSTGGASSFIIYNAASAALMRVRSNGNVGIGMAPTDRLSVNGTVRANAFVGDGSGLVNVPLPQLDTRNIVWVAMNGSPGGPGSLERPFSDPQEAYRFAASEYAGQPAAVIIAAGSYGPLEMNAGNVHVIGLGRPELGELAVSGDGTGTAKPRVENLVIRDPVIVKSKGVKFFNVRMERGAYVGGHAVEFHNCFIRNDGDALVLDGDASGVAVYLSALESQDGSALVVGRSVTRLEVIGCELSNHNRDQPVIRDYCDVADLIPPHLYARNYIRAGGGEKEGLVITGPADRSVAFHQNTVYGYVGDPGVEQYYANNVALHISDPKAIFLWRLAAKPFADDANNTTYCGHPPLGAEWKD